MEHERLTLVKELNYFFEQQSILYWSVIDIIVQTDDAKTSWICDLLLFTDILSVSQIIFHHNSNKSSSQFIKTDKHIRLFKMIKVIANDPPHLIIASMFFFKLEIRSVEHGICPIAEFTSL